jgi:hypothetical protein
MISREALSSASVAFKIACPTSSRFSARLASACGFPHILRNRLTIQVYDVLHSDGRDRSEAERDRGRWPDVRASQNSNVGRIEQSRP